MGLLGHGLRPGSRGGYVCFAQDAHLERVLVDAFRMEEFAPGSRSFVFARERVPSAAMSVFGVGGRPASLRLSSGVRFEFLFLVLSPDGRAYLVGEYAGG